MENPVWMKRTGWIFTGLGAFGLVASSAGKLSHGAAVVEGFAKFGIPEHLIARIGTIELLIGVLYAIPKTSVFAAILAAAYLGGAVMTHVRVGDPFVAPIILGFIIWFGLWFREPRL